VPGRQFQERDLDVEFCKVQEKRREILSCSALAFYQTMCYKTGIIKACKELPGWRNW
jgi:hypothetical protein